MDRRTVLTALAATPLAAVPAVASELKPTTALEQIKHHAAEISRILKETTPDGFKDSGTYFAIGKNLHYGAYPENYKFGDTYAVFKTHKGGWRLES